MTPRANRFFRGSQWVTSIALALSHGTNDAQKTMGIMSMGLVAFGVLPTFYVPNWVIAASALAMSAGTALGGWRLIRTLARAFPIHRSMPQLPNFSTVVILTYFVMHQ
jgi:PiT family inorganic phosphate transporter